MPHRRIGHRHEARRRCRGSRRASVVATGAAASEMRPRVGVPTVTRGARSAGPARCPVHRHHGHTCRRIRIRARRHDAQLTHLRSELTLAEVVPRRDIAIGLAVFQRDAIQGIAALHAIVTGRRRFQRRRSRSRVQPWMCGRPQARGPAWASWRRRRAAQQQQRCTAHFEPVLREWCVANSRLLCIVRLRWCPILRAQRKQLQARFDESDAGWRRSISSSCLLSRSAWPCPLPRVHRHRRDQPCRQSRSCSSKASRHLHPGGGQDDRRERRRLRQPQHAIAVVQAAR